MKLPQALQTLWGIDDYKKMPSQMREIVEKHSIGVTIFPEKIPDEDKTGSLSAANVDDENDQKAMDRLAKAMKDKGKMDWMTFFQGGAVFGLIIYILANLHVLPVVIK